MPAAWPTCRRFLVPLSDPGSLEECPPIMNEKRLQNGLEARVQKARDRSRAPESESGNIDPGIIGRFPEHSSHDPHA